MAYRPPTASKRPDIGARGKSKALYVDGNNFLRSWLGFHRSVNLDGTTLPMLYTQCLDCLEKNIIDFMSHAKAAGWRVSVFFDRFKKVFFPLH
jgi:hypothetical protein